MIKKTFVVLFIVSLAFNLFSQTEITSKEIYEHISYLASDDLGGRFPGTEGDRKSVEYIVKQFSDAGLKPLFDNGIQDFNIHTKNKIVKASLKIDDEYCKLNVDYQPLMFSASGYFKGEAVFAGYGMKIQDSLYSWNDYEGIDVKDKWVIVLRGKPNVDDFPDLFFDNNTKEYIKVIEAQDNGAIGVIFVNGYSNYPEDNLIDPCFERFLSSSKIPAYSVKRHTADLIFKSVGTNLKKIEKSFEKDKKPNSFDLKVNMSSILEIQPVEVTTHNVAFYIEGRNPALKDEYIVIGAHYDHLGMGGCGSGSRKPDTIAIHNGADDNASGTAGVLELAEYFAGNPGINGRSLIFVTFGAEERGLLGSKYFVDNLPVPIEKIYAMVNFDMIGKYGDKLSIMGAGTAKEFDSLLRNTEHDTSVLKISPSPKAYSGSDHASFIAKGIPALFFYASTAEDYHTPEDDIDLVRQDNEADILNFAAKFITNLSNQNLNLTFEDIDNKGDKGLGKNHGAKIKLGIIPSFEDTNNEGLKISGVNKDTPAEKAGMQADDIITEINGLSVTNIQDYMARMQKIKPGDLADFKIKRNDEIIELKVQF